MGLILCGITEAGTAWMVYELPFMLPAGIAMALIGLMFLDV